jgi:hypothetical protein
MKTAPQTAATMISKYRDYNVCHEVCNDVLRSIEVTEANMPKIDLYLDVKNILYKMELSENANKIHP